MAIFCAKSGSLQTIKGVFECKEMLREGVDYERYDWLKGDGSAYMTIRISNFAYDVVDYGNIKFFNTTDKEGLFLNVIRSDDNWIKLYLKYKNSQLRFAWHGGGSEQAVSLENGTLIIESKNRGTNQFNGRVINNSNTYNITSAWYFQGTGSLGGVVSAPKNVGISKIEVKRRDTGVVKTSRYPCQLLRPIPATLDANGKARVAGECGMYDAVSGKFFGNVASTGSFTVTND